MTPETPTSDSTPNDHQFRVRFTLRTMLGVVACLALLLAAWIGTQKYGLDAVNDLERAEFGEPYMTIRTDSPRSIFPLLVMTGLTTTISDTTTGNTYREPVSRRYYLWIGRAVRIGEWHRPKAC